MTRPRIDLAKLRARMRVVSHQTIYSMLDEAFDWLPAARLEQLVGRYMDLTSLRAEESAPNRDSPSRLRGAAEEFATASRRGDYFDPFGVNSKNCTEQSNGTISWISECNRLLERCVALASRRRGVGDVVAAFELLFELIDDAGSFEFDIVFFADEGGAYEFGIHWQPVMAAWFECFTREAMRTESYDERVADIVERGEQIAGEAHQRMAQVVRNRKPDPRASL